MERTVLLADDTHLFLRMEQDALHGSPVRVVTAADGVEALAIVRGTLPDVVVMDLHMPKMDGARCCREMKADPALRHIPVIIVTNAANRDDLARCKDSGCDLLLQKPLPPRAFLDALHKFLPEIDRRPRRVPFSGKIVLELEKWTIAGTGTDISETGLGTVLDAPPPEGTFRITFFLEPGCEGIKADATAVWTKRRSDGKTQAGLRLDSVVGPGLPFMRIHEIRTYINRCIAEEKRKP